jgi:hypothetical protein
MIAHVAEKSRRILHVYGDPQVVAEDRPKHVGVARSMPPNTHAPISPAPPPRHRNTPPGREAASTRAISPWGRNAVGSPPRDEKLSQRRK